MVSLQSGAVAGMKRERFDMLDAKKNWLPKTRGDQEDVTVADNGMRSDAGKVKLSGVTEEFTWVTAATLLRCHVKILMLKSSKNIITVIIMINNHKCNFLPVFCPSIQLCSCEHDISRTPWGQFCKFATNVHVDTRMNWSRWPKVNVTVTSQKLFLLYELDILNNA